MIKDKMNKIADQINEAIGYYEEYTYENIFHIFFEYIDILQIQFLAVDRLGYTAEYNVRMDNIIKKEIILTICKKLIKNNQHTGLEHNFIKDLSKYYKHCIVRFEPIEFYTAFKDVVFSFCVLPAEKEYISCIFSIDLHNKEEECIEDKEKYVSKETYQELLCKYKEIVEEYKAKTSEYIKAITENQAMKICLGVLCEQQVDAFAKDLGINLEEVIQSIYKDKDKDKDKDKEY